MTNLELIHQFYTAFAKNNIKGMLDCYHPDIEFEDPAFGKLKGERAKNMWRMLLQNAQGGINISHTNASADDQHGSVNWRAEYVFSQTNRKVVNLIAAKFVFKDGKIIQHTDAFDLYKWSKQAFGLTGWLIGWTPFFKHKLQQRTNGLLERFMNASSAAK
ncbi:MAG: nuclear transport factor 2 family protein [Saprospiraceae bacterium]|nr:nuclear transport factor 2 family protein [Saprospiraceae bacterium]